MHCWVAPMCPRRVDRRGQGRELGGVGSGGSHGERDVGEQGPMGWGVPQAPPAQKGCGVGSWWARCVWAGGAAVLVITEASLGARSPEGRVWSRRWGARDAPCVCGDTGKAAPRAPRSR